ncbi:MAG: hypothetical protein OXG26_09035 [Caldilineaceae bacterium]|uniref:Uncharacterized protein n=1 Tax=Caldilineaceae bacterium SB0661_bin_32 TaxID=2605255 RepID=A0A6B1DBN4_9CHLR|nr:hypothetical protein [Caldilineaceae bacterium]MXZ20463.1 hypothetical protein [Caldilineaceae bacterium SB0665_bin_25]MYC97044.1 hypothetical protein [Caldilineaceae bacterium SB0661_bin_32]
MTQGNSGPPPGPPPETPGLPNEPLPEPGTVISWPMLTPDGKTLSTVLEADIAGLTTPPYGTLVFTHLTNKVKLYSNKGWIDVELPYGIKREIAGSFLPIHSHPPSIKTFRSSATYTLDAEHSITHGLGKIPKGVQVYLECVTAELGYSVGDVIQYSNQKDFLVYDLTGAAFKIFVEEGEILEKNTDGVVTGSSDDISADNWRVRVTAWA